MDDRRLLLSDAGRERIAAVLQEVKHPAEAPPRHGDRDFVEALLYRARTGVPWRDLPERFGAWDAVFQVIFERDRQPGQGRRPRLERQ
jgi:putative transposase